MSANDPSQLHETDSKRHHHRTLKNATISTRVVKCEIDRPLFTLLAGGVTENAGRWGRIVQNEETDGVVAGQALHWDMT